MLLGADKYEKKTTEKSGINRVICRLCWRVRTRYANEDRQDKVFPPQAPMPPRNMWVWMRAREKKWRIEISNIFPIGFCFCDSIGVAVSSLRRAFGPSATCITCNASTTMQQHQIAAIPLCEFSRHSMYHVHHPIVRRCESTVWLRFTVSPASCGKCEGSRNSRILTN